MAEIAGVAALLGGGRASQSPMQLVARIARGLPLEALERATALLAPSDPAFKYRIVPKASLARRQRSRRLSADESERVARLARIWAAAREVWGSDDETRDFLFRPHPMLEDRRPIDVVIASELGAQVVDGIIGGLRYGSAA